MCVCVFSRFQAVNFLRVSDTCDHLELSDNSELKMLSSSNCDVKEDAVNGLSSIIDGSSSTAEPGRIVSQL